jgi:small subunit ribosomal protein S1
VLPARAAAAATAGLLSSLRHLAIAAGLDLYSVGSPVLSVVMAGSGNASSAPSPRPVPPGELRRPSEPPLRKPPQVLLIKKDAPAADETAAENAQAAPESQTAAAAAAPVAAAPAAPAKQRSDEELFDMGGMEGLSMADLLGPADQQRRTPQTQRASEAVRRSVDDFDFDEEAFLAALDENEPVGTTGEVVKGVVIGVESDGVYVDIGGKAPGFMPKKEAALGVITNIKERFPKGLEVEVLVTREQNADGMVTISARALALRQSWEKVRQMEKEGKVLQVKINGFNRGGVTCDLEGLRAFIPRSQLQQGEQHEALVGKTLGVTFLEVNPETRKLVLSEKKAATAARFAELQVGQLVEGVVASIKPYGYFIDLGGISGLLHQSCVSGGQLRDLREVFTAGERVRALITELDAGRGRIALNTALLEAQPGEILIEKDKLQAEAEDRANKARSLLRQQEQTAG